MGKLTHYVADCFANIKLLKFMCLFSGHVAAVQRGDDCKILIVECEMTLGWLAL